MSSPAWEENKPDNDISRRRPRIYESLRYDVLGVVIGRLHAAVFIAAGFGGKAWSPRESLAETRDGGAEQAPIHHTLRIEETE
jgi:hypothetical protein